LNRRHFQRQPISLSALLHPEQGRSWLCTVRDFCEEGMLLTSATGGRALGSGDAPMPEAGDVVALHFSVATPDGQEHFRTQACIIRVLDSGNGLGVCFPESMPRDAFDCLMAFSSASGFVPRTEAERSGAQLDAVAEQSQALSGPQTGRDPLADDILRDKRISDADATRLRQRLREIVQRAMQSIGGRFFDIAGEDLLIKARDAGTNAVQSMYFEGLDIVEKCRDLIESTFTDGVLRQVDHISDLEEVLERRRRREQGDSKKLALIDTEQFEEWLNVAEVITKAENRYRDQLLDLRAQLGLIAKPWSHKDVVPVGPSVICWSFHVACENLEFRRQVKDDVYHAFGKALIPVLGNLYEALNKAFEESHVFPSVQELRTVLRERSVVRNRSGVRIDPEVYQGMESSVREAAMAADGVGPARAGQNPYAREAPGEAYSTARTMLGLNRGNRVARGEPADDMLAPAGTPSYQTFDQTDILSALGVIEDELGAAAVTDTRLKPRLLEVLREQHGDRKAFREEDFDTFEVMDNLVKSIQKDYFITEGIREWIQRLELTLNKLAAIDPEFLRHDTERPHSAMQMLNQLAHLGNATDAKVGIDREVGRRVDELLARVVSEFDGNADVFSEVVDELHPLIDRQSRAYRANIERTVRASEGQQKLGRARRMVIEAMEQRIGGKQVPLLVLELANPGWRNLLVHTHLRQGAESSDWLDALVVFDQVHGQMTGKIAESDDEYIDPDALLKRVVEGLTSISFDPSKRTPLIMRLSSVFVGDSTGRKAPVEYTDVAADGVAEALGLEDLLPDADPEIDSEDEDVRENWARAVERARRIQVGEWLATSDEQGRPLILTVAFLGDDHCSFVLVNRKGIKVRELALKEMTDGLHEGRITLLDDYDLPMMERASQRMLEDMHHRLAYQATHDDLTQLMNRKEFERVVESALNAARKEATQHALLYLDLDQFKLVNNTSGHTAGDELLRNIGDTITRTLHNIGAEVARLGGDEFGVLVRDIETQAARDMAEDVLNAIRAQRFDWDGRHYNLTASMGLVFIDQTTESTDAALQYADEACFTAKDAGRNRLQEYELGDARMMKRHGVMEFVTQLDKALDEERLILNCQRIRPILNPGVRLDHHFEILLTMMDELGDVMPPADFIFAAEAYNRMTTIDRWVIHHVLQWMSDNRSRLDEFAGFAINVSGHSVNDETFPDFVLAEFARTQAPTGKVCFEITETVAIANLDNAIDFMNRMKIIGCTFSLDDFGTGLSSYSYLRNLPVDYVKIDGVFVRDIANNPSDYAVVKSINEIGHYMDKQTIAEYVEDEAVLNALVEIGVDYVQGYQIEKPLLLTDLMI